MKQRAFDIEPILSDKIQYSTFIITRLMDNKPYWDMERTFYKLNTIKVNFFSERFKHNNIQIHIDALNKEGYTVTKK